MAGRGSVSPDYTSVQEPSSRGQVVCRIRAMETRLPAFGCKGRVMRDVALVVGAGPAGLAAAYELRRAGIYPRVIDQAQRVASSWRRRHDQLRLNTHRWFSHQPGRRIPRRFGAYPSRDDYVAYLEEYLEWSRLDVEFGVSAQRIDRDPDGGWVVRTQTRSRRARHLVIATGSDRLPRWPQWPGMDRFPGMLVHAGDFRHARDYAGKRVLLVGAGNSGVDIGNHLAAVDIEPSWVSVRNGPTIAPQYALGMPTHPLLVALRWLPFGVQDFNVKVVSRLVFGDLSRHGMPPPPKGALTRQVEDGVTLAVDNGFVKALKAGRFDVVPPVESVHGNTVRLVDGRFIEPDAIICATGYRLGLEPLVGHLGVLDVHGRPRWIAEHSSPDHQGLWFFGQNSSTYGNMNIRRAEARRLAEAIRGDLQCTGRPAPGDAVEQLQREEQP